MDKSSVILDVQVVSSSNGTVRNGQRTTLVTQLDERELNEFRAIAKKHLDAAIAAITADALKAKAAKGR